ncbi:MAG: alpha/beta hydrolase [Thiohalocapsa sp.]|jgi:alpha-beta hydrolase superfamily lysophospholipase|uniref:alpha/beta fold hydrolase n=1 Tax=Thiohalocapsa sp. TaxID=2497641 RepID=UPI0025F41A20|nr:alpha/beta fold hydrolase [Thiohalocapsa sp.]MCG6940035.1 alpha/beta hydrolase [Thiohalocapsa sp.]
MSDIDTQRAPCITARRSWTSLALGLGVVAGTLVVPLLAGCATPRPVPSAAPVLEPELAAEYARMPDGFRLPLRTWGPRGSDTLVLGLHGFNDYGKAFAPLAERLAADGVRVYAVDQRGFGAGLLAGRWHGSEQLATDLRDLAAVLHQRHPGSRLFVIGESMGAAVVLAALAEGPLPVDGVVLIAPAVWNRGSMPWYQRAALDTLARVAPRTLLTGQGVPIHPTDNMPMLRAMGADPLVLKGAHVDTLWGVTNLMDRAADGVRQLRGPPTLVLYGERDYIIPRSAYCRMVQDLPQDAPQLRLVLYRHGWHMLPRDRQGALVRNDIADWIRDPAEPLPSGEEVTPDGARLTRFCHPGG